MSSRTVGIVLFDGVETLDFAGPFEVFSVTEDRKGDRPFRVLTVAETSDLVDTIGGLSVQPGFDIHTAPHLDVIVVPGGAGTVDLMNNTRVIGWLLSRFEDAELLVSVCSGARVLARAGLLDGLRVTTHHQVADELAELAPGAVVESVERYIDTGRIITTGGISAGIDGSLYVVQRLVGERAARATAHYMEYDWAAGPGQRGGRSPAGAGADHGVGLHK
jgi:transcriptional regulator GlxA family with amidase domain